MGKTIGSWSLSRLQRGSLQDRWQIITVVVIIMVITIVLSITTEGCFKQSKVEEVGSSAPPEVRTLIFINQPATAVAGVAITPVTVELLDQYNHIMTGTSVSITTTNSSIVLNGTLSGTSDASGVVNFNDLMITKTDTYILTASVGVITASSTAFGITAAAANNLVFLQQPTTTTVGTAFSPVVTVKIMDVYNNAAIAATNPVSITVSSGTLGGPRLNVAAVAGIATFTGVTVDTTVATNLTLTATSVGLISANSTPFNIIAGAIVDNYLVVANSSVVTGSNQTATVTAKDAYGYTVTSASNTITMTRIAILGSPTVTFYTDGTYSTIKLSPVIYTLSSGVATIWYTAIHDGTAPDTFTITATDSAAKYGASGQVTVTNN